MGFEKQCAICRVEFEFTPIHFGGKTLFEPQYCDDCAESRIIQAEVEASRKRKEASKNRFRQMVPPIYLDTDENRLPRHLVDPLWSWEYGPLGVGFVGGSGKGKTRSGVLLLMKQHDDGRTVFFVTATDLALNTANQFADNPATRQIARSILDLCRSAQLLMIDDIGKNRMTDRAESELYDLLEYRTSRRLPTIWTSNSNGLQLRSMFTQDRGEAITRRLGREFSLIIAA